MKSEATMRAVASTSAETRLYGSAAEAGQNTGSAAGVSLWCAQGFGHRRGFGVVCREHGSCLMPPTHMFAHHRGGQRQPTPGNAHHQRPSPSPIISLPRYHTHTELPPGPGPSSNLSLIPTRQTLPGSQSEQRRLAGRQGSLWTRLRF